MHKCKITVLKRMLLKDIAEEYSSDPNLEPCAIYKDRSEFILETIDDIPEGFCPWAWADIQRDVVSIMTGGDMDWINRKGVQVVCCTDGLRPVVFKIERID
ncbi:MAG: TIGR04076 family protein [Acetivibrionales bacterium]|jgi:uncharacterized repeat protein (TIGR04076 family)